MTRHLFVDDDKIPDPPPWRDPARRQDHKRKILDLAILREQKEIIEAALVLRRPLLVCGPPGSGKSTLAHAIAADLELGRVLEWRITSRSSLTQALYRYDAIARIHDASLPENLRPEHSADIGAYIRLGPLGTAIALSKRGSPRVLLIDEIDKSDADLSNDMLHVLEEGGFEIPELRRLRTTNPEYHVGLDDDHSALKTFAVKNGVVTNEEEAPFIVITSNNEREFSPAFNRRVIRLDVEIPLGERLDEIVSRHLEMPIAESIKEDIIAHFEQRVRAKASIAIDQLVNALHIVSRSAGDSDRRERLRRVLMRPLDDE